MKSVDFGAEVLSVRLEAPQRFGSEELTAGGGIGPMGQMAMTILYSPLNPRFFGFGLRVLLGGALLLVAGCGPSIPALRAKAANEMNCPVSELDLERVDSDTMAVIGCGGEAIYSTYCDKTAEGKTCGWRADPKTENAE